LIKELSNGFRRDNKSTDQTAKSAKVNAKSAKENFFAALCD